MRKVLDIVKTIVKVTGNKEELRILEERMGA